MERLLAILVIPLLFVMGESAPAATFTDEVGRTIEVNGPPQRIVSVAPNVTEILLLWASKTGWWG